MKLRRYNPISDLRTIETWWLARGAAAFPPEVLSSVGFVAENQGVKVGALFLYTTNSAMCLLGWPISSPDSDKMVRSEALDMLIEACLAEAQRQGHTSVLTWGAFPALVDRYKRHGFDIADGQVTNLIRRF